MISVAVQGYNQACTSSNSGGISRLFVGDAEDFSLTAGTPDAQSSGYSAIARRSAYGSGATGTASVSSGAVTGVSVGSGGTGYSSAPTVVFAGGGGTGAAGTAVIVGGAIVSVTITTPGTGYTTAPTVSFTNPAEPGRLLYEIVSLADSLTAKATQSRTDGSTQWAYEIGGRLLKMQQGLVQFAEKLDAAAACGQLMWVWQDNNGAWWVIGEKYVGSNILTKFRILQDGSVVDWGTALNTFNGMTLSAKGNYSRPPYTFTGGSSGILAMTY